MMKKFNIKGFNINIDPKNLWYIVVYCGIIFFVILVGIFPFYKYHSSLIEENKKLQSQINEQKELGPIYLNLLKSVDDKQIRVFSSPEKTAIPRGDAGKFQDDFRAIAGKAGLTLVSFTPDMNTIVGSSTSFLYNVVIKGEFANFRKMLIALGAVPYLDRIEEINIQQQPYSMEFRTKIWIAIK
ncbi:MAG: hypothetical protein CVU62_13715 [Deltaproteobacteria bacterium HGW-Deltaproteobacteria-2]|jgi:hypothetical protein|nr:MAG: hypothetical protein CVU62_13715 [Deltaproteobacteria bacterium HGW-Deltaproteobacteria-2]